MRAVVTGMIATYPVGGVVWDYGQYLLGLERLGFDVFYLEDTGWQTYDPTRKEYGEDGTYGARFLQQSLADLSPSLTDRWHFRDMNGKSYGIDATTMAEIVAGADLFLNVSGGSLLREEYMRCRRKVFIDTDPGWNHFVNFPKWDRRPGWQGSRGYRAHDHFFTYAERIGQPDCALPTLGLPWQPTRPVVIPERWRPAPPGNRWTTVMTWNNFQKPIEHAGVTYGSKEREFGRVEEIPSRAAASFEVAVGGAGVPHDRWRSLGWSVIDSHSISETAEAYRSYIQSSRGEFSVAKNVYVATRSGWFSCRSICYLAAGRPAVIQETGFSGIIPTGEGLFAFSTPEQALQAIASVEADYSRHQNAAQEIARLYFDSKRVLCDLLERIGLG
ncbi:MAG: glycosyltransferase family 1 protein [Nitrospirae bacterium]|nr:glycosyltransferase family 1 protein [Candidatus Manganitrophaceae bacterium]